MTGFLHEGDIRFRVLSLQYSQNAALPDSKLRERLFPPFFLRILTNDWLTGIRRTVTVNDQTERKYGDPTSELTESEVFLTS